MTPDSKLVSKNPTVTEFMMLSIRTYHLFSLNRYPPFLTEEVDPVLMRFSTGTTKVKTESEVIFSVILFTTRVSKTSCLMYT